MPEVQDTQIHLPCQHFRCDSFRFDKQKRRLGEGLMRWQMPASTVQKITGIHGDTIRSIHKQTMDEALVRRWLQISGLPVWRWTGVHRARPEASHSSMEQAVS